MMIDDFQLIIAMILQSNMVLFLIFPNRFFWLGDAYFKHSVPSVDSSQRRRSPLATSLYWRLRSWRTSGSERRALQLWVHLVCIMHVGDPLFIEEVIFKQSALEPSGLASHFMDFLFGQTDDYTKKLAEGQLQHLLPPWRRNLLRRRSSRLHRRCHRSRCQSARDWAAAIGFLGEHENQQYQHFQPAVSQSVSSPVSQLAS